MLMVVLYSESYFLLSQLLNDFYFLQDTEKGKSLDTLWIFPYYMEPQITKYGFQMSDYQVTYSQNGRYRQGHKTACRRKLGSPVRIFTTLQLNCIGKSIC